MVVTHFCGCQKCTGVWFGHPTSAGVQPVAEFTVACDTGLLPLGTILRLPNGSEVMCQTRGGDIKGKRLDLFVGGNTPKDHQRARVRGKFKADVLVLHVGGRRQ
jgi:3D (Asp-Asp-Asp) domain-containing protein